MDWPTSRNSSLGAHRRGAVGSPHRLERGLPSPRTLRIATLNCRNAVDGWPERAELLAPQLVELQPDVIGLQELRHFYLRQARWIANRAAALDPALAYGVHPTYKSGMWWFWEGIATLTRLPIVERSRVRLDGQARVANVTRVRLPGGELLDFYNVHLASGLANEDLRIGQARKVLDWMDSRPGVAQVLVGDFNSRPSAPTIEVLTGRLRSAHPAVHGSEPPRTIPTPFGGRSGEGVVIDYVFVNDRVEVRDAWVTLRSGRRRAAASARLRSLRAGRRDLRSTPAD